MKKYYALISLSPVKSLSCEIMNRYGIEEPCSVVQRTDDFYRISIHVFPIVVNLYIKDCEPIIIPILVLLLHYCKRKNIL